MLNQLSPCMDHSLLSFCKHLAHCKQHKWSTLKWWALVSYAWHSTAERAALINQLELRGCIERSKWILIGIVKTGWRPPYLLGFQIQNAGSGISNPVIGWCKWSPTCADQPVPYPWSLSFSLLLSFLFTCYYLAFSAILLLVYSFLFPIHTHHWY